MIFTGGVVLKLKYFGIYSEIHLLDAAFQKVSTNPRLIQIFTEAILKPY